MKLARIPKQDAERVRKRLFRLGLARKDVGISCDGSSVFVPLKEGVDGGVVRETGVDVVEGGGPPQACYRSPLEIVAELADIPEDLKRHLPRKWELFGDVLVLRIPRELQHLKTEVAVAYAGVLKAKTVCEETGVIEGEHRTPCLRVLVGSDTETVHLENGIRYKFDVTKIMFSSGNVYERQLMGELDCRNETVVDMFAGIGYFTLPIALKSGAERVFACEINPVSFHYLRENIVLNGAEGRVETFLGDNRDSPGRRIADRVIMGYLGNTEAFLRKAFDLARNGGVIYYHEACPINLLPERPVERILDAAGGRGCEILRVRKVKSFRPSTTHVVVEARVLD